MRLLLMASYLGVPYQAGLGPDGHQVTLFSLAPPPEELGFTAGPGHWRKQVSVTDLGALWQSRPVGDYRGERCLVLDDVGDRLHIAYLGRDAARAAQLGYWEIDREVFEVVVARHDVTGLTEERVDFPLAAAMFPPSGPESQTDGPAAVVTETTSPAGYGGTAVNGGSAVAGYARGVPGFPGGAPGNGGGATRNDRPEENGGADHAARMPDRVAAWHGSPAPEPWPGPPAGDEAETGAGSDPRSGPLPERDHRSELGAARTGRPVTWTEPGTGRELGPEPGTGRELGPEPETGRELGPEPETGRELGPETWTKGGPGPGTWAERGAGPDPWSEREPGFERETTRVPIRRSGRKDRISPESVFAELLRLAAIPQAAYAVDEEVPGAMCLVEADGGFEVFSRTDAARLEIQFFEDEEAAYFYLFGVLAAEAIRNGRLAPSWPDRANGHGNGASAPGTPTATENVSKYLRHRKLPKPASHTGIVN